MPEGMNEILNALVMAVGVPFSVALTASGVLTFLGLIILGPYVYFTGERRRGR